MVLAAYCEHPANAVSWPDRAADEVGCLLDAHEARFRGIAIPRGMSPDRGVEGLARECASLAIEHGDDGPRDRRGASGFGLDRMAFRPTKTSSPPGRTCTRIAISLHIVPDGRKTAAS